MWGIILLWSKWSYYDTLLLHNIKSLRS